MDIERSSVTEYQRALRELRAAMTLLTNTAKNADPSLEMTNFEVNSEHLSDRDPKRVATATKTLLDFSSLIDSASQEKINVSESKDFFSYFLKATGLACPQNYMDSLTKDLEIVEAYDLDHVQLFRNFTFMRVCGYSLADVLTYEWPELFERSQIITEAVIAGALKAVEKNQTVAYEVQVHYMKERFSESRRVHRVDFQHVAPLNDKHGQPVGYVISSHAKTIDKQPKHDLRFLG